MTDELSVLEVIVDGVTYFVPASNAEHRRDLLRRCIEKFQVELVVKLDGKVICVSRND